MNAMRITRILLILTPVIWLAWDFAAFFLGGNPATESANIFAYGTIYPEIPLFWGYLTGHFFAEKRLPSTQVVGVSFFKRKESLIALAVPTIWLLLDLFRYPSGVTTLVRRIPGPGHGSIEMVALGTIIGFVYFQMDDQTLDGPN